MSKIFLGIDISKASFDACLIISEHKIKVKKFSNNKSGFKLLLAWITELNIAVENIHACMEATGIYGDSLADFLYKINCTVSVVNPARIKGFGMSELSRTKTDKADSKLIARFCKAMNPSAWKPTEPEYKELQQLVRHLDDLKKLKLMEENRLESTSLSNIKKSINRIIKNIDKEIESVTKAIDEHIDQNPKLRKNQELLKTIPGVGDNTIMRILGFIQHENFDCVKKLDAFIGLNPKQIQSGTSVNGRTRISKIGNKELRKSLYFPAIVAKKYNPIIKKFCQRLEAKGKPIKVIICAVMRKLIHIIYGVLKSGRAFNADLAVA